MLYNFEFLWLTLPVEFTIVKASADYLADRNFQVPTIWLIENYIIEISRVRLKSIEYFEEKKKSSNSNANEKLTIS